MHKMTMHISECDSFLHEEQTQMEEVKASTPMEMKNVRLTKGESEDSAFTQNVYQSKEEEEIVHTLRVHFADPYTRCCREPNTCKKIPKKLILLLLKLAFVTTQLCMFGRDRSILVRFINRNNVALKHLLLKDWNADHEVLPYPPNVGPYALYTIEELHDHIDFAVMNFYRIPLIAVGSFFIEPEEHPLELCVTYYEKGIYSRNQDNEAEFSMDDTMKKDCVIVTEQHRQDYGLDPSIRDLMRSLNGSLVRLMNIELHFVLFSIHLDNDDIGLAGKTACFRIDGKVYLDNTEINGQIPISLQTSMTEFVCSRDDVPDVELDDVVIAGIILLLSFISVYFSGHSFKDSVIVLQKTRKYFNTACPNIDGEDVSQISSRGQWEILKIRDLVIFASDICTLAGTCFKLVLNSQTLSSSSALYDTCGILMGTGCMMVWLGVLHYLSYDSKFNLLFRVMERAAPQVLRFLSAVVMLFIGFALCGWVVLGPYHIKFQTLSNSFQNLISLLDGDELYVTYKAVDGGKETIWWFNTIYITTFHIFFSVIAMNIFIAIFTTTYEIMQEKGDKSDLRKFLDQFSHKKFILPDGCKDYFCCVADDQECWRYKNRRKKTEKDEEEE